MKIKIILPVIIDGVDRFVGEFVDVDDTTAIKLITAGRAVVATDT